MGNRKIWWKTVLKSALWFIGIWAALLITLQFTLSEKVLTRIVNKYAAEYIEGEVAFGKASVSMFKQFPRVFITLEDFRITYPSERFEAAEQIGAPGHLMHAGGGEVADTLASFKRFSASIDVVSAMKGTLRIPHLRLVQPRIFAHFYSDGQSNLDILKISSEENSTEEDTTSLPLPKHLSVGRISFSRHPHIVYTNSKDTLFTMIDVARIGFTGEINTNQKPPKNRPVRFSPRSITKGLTIDSLIVAGRMKKDTVALSINRFYVKEDDGLMCIDGKARAMLATRTAGRIHLPIAITGNLHFPKDTVPAISIKNFKANVGDFPIVADADVRLLKDRAEIKAQMGIKDCRLNDVFHGFVKNIIPELEKIETDARLTILAECDGDYVYSTGEFPKFTAKISLPEANIKYADLDQLQMKVGIAASGYTDSRGRMNATINKVSLSTDGLNMNIMGGGKDLLGNDPSINIDGNIQASLDTLVSILPDTLGIIASGEIAAKVQGNALLSQLSIYNFSHADIVGNLNSDQILVQIPADSIDVDIKGLDVFVGPEDRVSRRDSTKSFRLVGITAKVQQGKFIYGNSLSANTNSLLLSAKNSVSSETISDTVSRLNPLSGRLSARSLIVKDAEGSVLTLYETGNSFMLRPQKGQPKVPVLSLTSKNEKIILSQDKN